MVWKMIQSRKGLSINDPFSGWQLKRRMGSLSFVQSLSFQSPLSPWSCVVSRIQEVAIFLSDSHMGKLQPHWEKLIGYKCLNRGRHQLQWLGSEKNHPLSTSHTFYWLIINAFTDFSQVAFAPLQDSILVSALTLIYEPVAWICFVF